MLQGREKQPKQPKQPCFEFGLVFPNKPAAVSLQTNNANNVTSVTDWNNLVIRAEDPQKAPFSKSCEKLKGSTCDYPKHFMRDGFSNTE